MPTAEKAAKERDRTQMPVAKKERPKYKCWWQMKNGCPSQASRHQMKETQQLKPPQKTKRLPTCKHKVGKKHHHQTQQSNRLLSATKEWTTTVIRAQSKNNCANDEQMESQTNHN